MSDHDRKKRIAFEESKIRRTSHWDLDYLPLDQVQALCGRSRPRRDAAAGAESPRPVAQRQWGITCMLLGAGLLALAAVAARYLAG